MATSDDDGLANTATSDALAETATSDDTQGTVAGPRVRAPTNRLSGTLGRYRIDGELGAGGMGVVHAAFDPSLERRIALKVLRNNETAEARQRLLREARAMAKLAHPNVVVVYEVGSEHGRDFVAMELIEGGTLAQWLAADKRSEREILAAFLAAGSGLAAAHAAGLVHRDFKPHNVLRDKSGRIAVTDFGLVVAAPIRQSAPTAAITDTGPVNSTRPSSMSGLTEAGSVLGTPAYMAPEQWDGAGVGPPADQYAFCVALWEALAGERPYRGKTIEELRAAQEEGPRALDATKIPRRLRPLLVRGLDPEPRNRWPSMNALLAAIRRTERRPVVLFALAGLLVIAAATVYVVTQRETPKVVAPAPGCAAPVLDPATVWSPAIRTALGPLQAPPAAVVDAQMKRWHEARERSCKLEGAERAARLECLDGALARIDLVVRAWRALGADRRTDADDLVVDPVDCEQVRPPRLVLRPSPEQLEAMKVYLTYTGPSPGPDVTEPVAKALLGSVERDPCAAAFARMMLAWTRDDRAQNQADFEEARQAAKRCGDDRLIADVELQVARIAVGQNIVDAEVAAIVNGAEAAAANLPHLAPVLLVLRATAQRRTHELDAAITNAETATARFLAAGRITRYLLAAERVVDLRHERGTADDIAQEAPILAAARAHVVPPLSTEDPLVLDLDRLIALERFRAGDVAGSDAKLLELYRPQPHAGTTPVRIAGKVVDAAGAPIAGATVYTGWNPVGSSLRAAMLDGYVQMATTASDGTFELAEADPHGVVIAQFGEQRSRSAKPGPALTLALAATSRLEGRVDLGGRQPATVSVQIMTDSDSTFPGIQAPVHRDGTFAVSGVPRGRVRVQALVNSGGGLAVDSKEIVVTGPTVTGVHIKLEATDRILGVLVRSITGTAPENALVMVLKGKVASMTAKDLALKVVSGIANRAQPLRPEDDSPPLRAKSKPGDLFALVHGAPRGIASACAISVPRTTGVDPFDLKALEDPKSQGKIAVPCVTVGAADEVVVVEVPPWPRLD